VKRIECFEDLIRAAGKRQSVCFDPTDCQNISPKPAAFVLNMNALVVHNWIKRGLVIYTPSPKRYGRKDGAK